MKQLILILAVLCPLLLRAQDATPPQKPSLSEQRIEAREVRDVAFDTAAGVLTFQVGPDKFYYPVHSGETLAESYGVVSELRHADQVTFRFDPAPVKPGDSGHWVGSFVFHYDRLRP